MSTSAESTELDLNSAAPCDECRHAAGQMEVRASSADSCALRIAASAIWRQHPEFTAQQVIQSLGTERPVGYARVCALLRECHLAAAKHSPVQKQLRWRLDRWTAARVRVSAIWKRHPEFTARQIMRNLKPQHAVPASFVQKVMRQCWRASARRSPAQRLTGRRVYSPWRGMSALERRARNMVAARTRSQSGGRR